MARTCKTHPKLDDLFFLHESSVAAGVRRVEAITGDEAEAYFNKKLDVLARGRNIFWVIQKTMVKQVEVVA